MSRSALFLLLLILWFILGWWLCKNYICGVGAAAGAAALAPAVIDKCDATLNIKDGSTFESTANRTVRFLRSNYNNLVNSTSTQDALERTTEYLSNNKGRTLVITGRYDDDETYRNGILPNLGLARATTVKNILAEMGTPTNQMDVRGVLDTTICYSGDTLTNGLNFGFADAAASGDRLAAIKDRLFGKPITVYFQTNSDNLNLSAQQRQDFADLSYYLDNVSEASLSVEGHTDNRGDENYNRRLSRKRAEFVNEYIVKNAGIGAKRLSSQGFGPEKPIDSNDTDDGRAKNRRVEVILK